MSSLPAMPSSCLAVEKPRRKRVLDDKGQCAALSSACKIFSFFFVVTRHGRNACKCARPEVFAHVAVSLERRGIIQNHGYCLSKVMCSCIFERNINKRSLVEKRHHNRQLTRQYLHGVDTHTHTHSPKLISFHKV